jgi:hypothetical protein
LGIRSSHLWLWERRGLQYRSGIASVEMAMLSVAFLLLRIQTLHPGKPSARDNGDQKADVTWGKNADGGENKARTGSQHVSV